MTKKNKTYFLLIVVVIIWGILIFKVVDALKGSNDDIISSNFKPEPFNFNFQKEIDTFTLIANYRDPFLDDIKEKVTRQRRNKTHIKTKQPEEPLPLITYSGYMTDPINKEGVFFVNINNQQHMLKRNETVENVKIISGNDKIIVVQYGNQKITIPITN